MSDPALQTDDVEQHTASGSLALEDRPERDADAVIASAIGFVNGSKHEYVSSSRICDATASAISLRP